MQLHIQIIPFRDIYIRTPILHLKIAMRAIGFIKTTSFKLSFLAIGLTVVIYCLYSKDTLSSKAQRISFPGITHVNFNRSMKDLNLEKVDAAPDQTLIQNLNQSQIKMMSPLFIDKQNNIMVFIGEKTSDQQLVFAVIKNNQVTQLQKVNEITDKKITLQYGRVILNTLVATASTTAASDAL